MSDRFKRSAFLRVSSYTNMTGKGVCSLDAVYKKHDSVEVVYRGGYARVHSLTVNG